MPASTELVSVANAGAIWRQRLAGYPYVLPAVLVIIGVMSYPFLYSVYLSFQATPSYTTETHFTGLGNYIAVLQDPVFRHSLVTTVIWTVGCTITDLVLGMGAAILVSQLSWFRGPIRAALMLPYIAVFSEAGDIMRTGTNCGR